MGKALASGFRHTLRSWPMVMLLYAVLLAPTLVFGAIAWARLQSALDHSMAARTMLKDLDLNVLVDLFVHHADMFMAIAIAGMLLAGGSLMVWVWLNAATIAAASAEGTLPDALRRGSEVFPSCCALWVMVWVVNALVIGSFYLLGDFLLRVTTESSVEMTRYWIVAGCGLGAAAWVLVSTVIHDHARVHCVATEAHAAAACRWALRYCLRDRRSVLLLLMILGVGGVAWAGYQSVAMVVAPTSNFGVAFSLLWGQVWVLARAALRFWYFAAANELQASVADGVGVGANL